MKTIVALLTVCIALVSGSPALAQSKDSLGEILGGVLGGVLSGRSGTQDQLWRGHLVQSKGTTMIFRGDDGAVYTVDMSAINTQIWHPIALGTPLTLAARPGTGARTLIAVRIEPEQPDRSGRLREKRPFRTLHGRVERVEGSQLTFRATDGTVLAVDVAQITGEAELRTNDYAYAILESAPANTVVWIDREDRSAQDRGGWDRRNGLSREYTRWHGHLVQSKGTTMIFRGDDGKTSTVDMSAINTHTWHPMEIGQALTLAAKPGREPNTLIAGRVNADPADRTTGKPAKRSFVTAQGKVESVRGSQMRFRMSGGQALMVNAAQMPGFAGLRGNEQGTLTYEPGARGEVTGLWLDRGETQAAAAVSPAAIPTGAFQRVSGYVQSVGWSTISLKADDGRVLAVDTSHVEAQMRNSIRPGDLLSIVGKPTAQADQFVADFIEREARR